MKINAIDASVCVQRVRELVEQANDGVKEVANGSGICQAAIYHYLNGRVPSLSALFRLAQYAGKPMEWFLIPDKKILEECRRAEERDNFTAGFAFARFPRNVV